MTYKQALRLPRILADQVTSLELWPKMKSEGNLLYEAEWLLELLDSSDLGEEYSAREAAGLTRYVRRLRAKGVTPQSWDNDTQYRVYEGYTSKRCIREFASKDDAMMWCWSRDHDDPYRIEWDENGKTKKMFV